MLARLYDNGHDRTISRSFDKFHAILGASNAKFMLAYMAEINLGVNGRECNKLRIADVIEVIERAVNGWLFSPGVFALLCWQWLARLGGVRKGQWDAYFPALVLLDQTNASNVAAPCCKNLGTALEKLDKPEAAYATYTQALALDSNLPEAHFALDL